MSNQQPATKAIHGKEYQIANSYSMKETIHKYWLERDKGSLSVKGHEILIVAGNEGSKHLYARVPGGKKKCIGYLFPCIQVIDNNDNLCAKCEVRKGL